MKRLYHILIGLIGLSVFSSCVREIVMDAKEKPQVVVSCIISDDPVQTLKLSFTKGASLSEAPPLTEAIATLYEVQELNQAEYINRKMGDFEPQGDGVWTLEYAARAGYKYRLEVQVPGYDLIYAEDIMPSDTAIVKVEYFSNLYDLIEPWSGWIIIPDDPNDFNTTGDLLIWPEDEAEPKYETFYSMKSSYPVWISAKNYNKETGRHETAEYICTDATVSDSLNITDKVYESLKKESPNPYKLSNYGMKVISPEIFYNAHQMELYPNLAGKPLFESYIRLIGNHVFSLAGSFSGEYWYKQPKGTIILFPGFPSYNTTDIYENNHFNNVEKETAEKGYIQFSTVSELFDKFLTESYAYQQIMESSDLTTIFLRDNMYTNINGGVGIFGAQLLRRYQWSDGYTYVDAGAPEKLEEVIEYYRNLYRQ